MANKAVLAPLRRGVGGLFLLLPGSLQSNCNCSIRRPWSDELLQQALNSLWVRLRRYPSHADVWRFRRDWWSVWRRTFATGQC